MLHNPFLFGGTPPTLDLHRRIRNIIREADIQGHDATCAYYPETDTFAVGLNGAFDIDTALEHTEDTDLMDILSNPITGDTHPEVVEDIAADVIYALDVDPLASRRQVRACLNVADYSGNTVRYYERRDGQTRHERVYHPSEGLDDERNPLARGEDISRALEDVELDADEIVAELEAAQSDSDE